MKSIQYLIVCLLFGVSVQQTKAQQTPVYNNYVINPYIYNPARAGDKTDGGVINLGFRKQWDDIPYGPITGNGTWDSRIKESNMALGVSLTHDRVGKHISNTMAGITYNYRLPFNKSKDHGINIGIQAGIISQKFNFLDAETSDGIFNDNAAVTANSRATNFDLTLGINYHLKGLNVGFSVPQVLNGRAKFRGNVTGNESSMFHYEREYLLFLSYEARFGGKDKRTWMITPSVLFRKYKSIEPQLDFNLMAGYKELIWIGGGYRSGGGYGGFISSEAAGFHVTAGFGIKERANLFYTFELPLKTVRSNFGYTHEVTLQFNLTKKVDATEYEKNKKKVDDEVAKLNQKADDAGSKAVEAIDKGDELTDKVQTIDKSVKEAFEKLNAQEKDIEKISARLENIVFKKFGSIYFENNKDILTSEAQASLDAFKSKLGEMKGNYFIYLAGNSSQEGEVGYNQMLSARRADFVKKYLEGVGISQRILLLPYGENSWVTEKQDTEGDRAKNRRVDIYLAGE
jgi:type IX secretion system PorP/SprF family membrane protein